MYAQPMNDMEDAPQSEVLSVHECWSYLQSSSVGRLALTGDTGPEIFPVNYLPEDGTVIFRTGPGTKMDALLDGGRVALEADGLNSYGTIAWSVIVKGAASALKEDDPGLQTADQGLSPWEPGDKEFVFRITPAEVTGRRFVISDSKRWWPARGA
jgi:nitroimidazol reductase NimA-like FMN-containing flavoprotein (pyridoxamine 5'-phosphate oxidase superfamily)